MILAWGHLSAQGVIDILGMADLAQSAAARLVECFYRSMRPDWPWFESRHDVRQRHLAACPVRRRAALA